MIFVLVKQKKMPGVLLIPFYSGCKSGLGTAVHSAVAPLTPELPASCCIILLVSCSLFFIQRLFRGHFALIAYRQGSGGWHATKVWNHMRLDNERRNNSGKLLLPIRIKHKCKTSMLGCTQTEAAEPLGPQLKAESTREMALGATERFTWGENQQSIDERDTHAHALLICEAWRSRSSHTEYSLDLTVCHLQSP